MSEREIQARIQALKLAIENVGANNSRDTSCFNEYGVVDTVACAKKFYSFITNMESGAKSTPNDISNDTPVYKWVNEINPF